MNDDWSVRDFHPREQRATTNYVFWLHFHPRRGWLTRLWRWLKGAS